MQMVALAMHSFPKAKPAILKLALEGLSFVQNRRAGLYKQMAELRALVQEYRESPAANQALRGPIVENLNAAGARLPQFVSHRPPPRSCQAAATKIQRRTCPRAQRS